MHNFVISRPFRSLIFILVSKVSENLSSHFISLSIKLWGKENVNYRKEKFKTRSKSSKDKSGSLNQLGVKRFYVS